MQIRCCLWAINFKYIIPTEEKMSENIVNIEEKKDILPVLPLRGLNIFPHMMFNFDVGRKKSIAALESAMASDSRIFLVTQKNLKADEPNKKDLYTMGTVAKVRQILKLQNEVVRVMIEGESRGRLCDMLEEKNYMVASVSILKEEKKEATSKKDLALLRKIHEAFSIYAGIAGNVSDSVAVNVLDNKDIGGVCDYICQNISLDFRPYQEMHRLILRPLP